MLEENGGEVRLEKGRLERMGVSPGWCGSVDRALACEPKGRWFDSQSGHMPGLWTRSLVGIIQEATTH